MYAIVFKKSAVKGLRRMPERISGRMLKELDRIASDPPNHSGDWKRLTGSKYWRLRVGRYRAICDLRDGELVLLVINAGPRGDIYK
ncbi:MAG: type II toxin-antitoxin system RelE/ParE family toxin [Wenzhouxiangellaceae bacterium]|nr:type II toxin-antitoxin system RelE/ParE family toxin [Wenzhouxiangellaceae bacterium]MBS3748051.1 type II toxin-antitoxin system RelE/ParE family toxin [Wenzhouxiangellaceae bacterium]MBS3824689.1 type II toxin-antitoxin system RelE/ParE family toxin [Wenzhouxiangellaceae bacterium]